MRETASLVTSVASVSALIALLAWPASSGGQTPTAPDCKSYGNNTALTSDLLVPGMLPPCVAGVTTAGPFVSPVDNLQHGFDLYSWLTFAALNSPADGTTSIGKGAGLGGDAPTVWESYKQLPDVMLENGAEPSKWGEPAPIPPECGGGVVTPGTMVVHIEEETFNQPFKSGPLIDQNGNYALFVILMNKDMFEYIRDNKLYSKKGQANFSESVNFPSGTTDPAPGVGAIMIKASWKVLAGKDDPTKFHTIEGLIYTPKSDNPKRDATCERRKLGLIGFHVGHKTKTAPQWLWTTFEHVANVPEQADASAGRNLLASYNFYDPGCDPLTCRANQLPPTPWEPSVQPFPNGFKSQITRVVPVTSDVVKINALSQSVAGIKGTVWENYMLVSTQWPSNFQCATSKDPSAQPDPMCAPAPTYLANTTLETYSQGTVPLASSSCIACHFNATTHPGATAHQRDPVSSDFTYILEKAR
jgi:hypothetical protein